VALGNGERLLTITQTFSQNMAASGQKNLNRMHVQLHPTEIQTWEGKWDVLKKSVRPVQSELAPG
jgi:hypothetical protein